MSYNNGLNDVLASRKKKTPEVKVNGPATSEVQQQREVKNNPPEKRKYDHLIHYDPGISQTEQGDEENVQTSESIPRKRFRKRKSLLEAIKAPDAAPVCCTYFKRRGRVDMPLFLAIIVLTIFGLVMMSSASYAQSLFENRDSYDFIKQQIEGVLLGMALMLALSIVDYKMLITPFTQMGGHFKRLFCRNFGIKHKKVDESKLKGNGLNPAHILFVGAVIVMIYTCFFGQEVADAKRWVTFFGIRFQPSEFMKFFLIILMAYMLNRLYEQRKTWFPAFSRYAVVIIVCAALCMAQRHYSALVIVVVICYAMMISAEVSSKNIVIFTIFLAFVALVFVAFFSDKIAYIFTRFGGWFDPFGDTGDTTYQTSQSLITIGSGGFFGRGLGNSIMKYYYLPEAQNDFVFSIVCEELGIVGGVTVVLLFVLFGYRGYKISKGAKDKFGSLLALGITVQLVLQAFFNIGVACNALPNTGISLPFFSYGRTAIVIQLAEVGVLLSISRNSDT